MTHSRAMGCHIFLEHQAYLCLCRGHPSPQTRLFPRAFLCPVDTNTKPGADASPHTARPACSQTCCSSCITTDYHHHVRSCGQATTSQHCAAMPGAQRDSCGIDRATARHRSCRSPQCPLGQCSAVRSVPPSPGHPTSFLLSSGAHQQPLSAAHTLHLHQVAASAFPSALVTGLWDTGQLSLAEV